MAGAQTDNHQAQHLLPEVKRHAAGILGTLGTPVSGLVICRAEQNLVLEIFFWE